LGRRYATIHVFRPSGDLRPAGDTRMPNPGRVSSQYSTRLSRGFSARIVRSANLIRRYVSGAVGAASAGIAVSGVSFWSATGQQKNAAWRRLLPTDENTEALLLQEE